MLSFSMTMPCFGKSFSRSYSPFDFADLPIFVLGWRRSCRNISMDWNMGYNVSGFSFLAPHRLCKILPTRHKSLLVVSAAKPYILKTHKSSASRFKITGTGKIMRRRVGMRHLLSKKSKNRKRRLSKMVEVKPCDYKHIMRALPYAKIKKKGTRDKIARRKRAMRAKRLKRLQPQLSPPSPKLDDNLKMEDPL